MARNLNQQQLRRITKRIPVIIEEIITAVFDPLVTEARDRKEKVQTKCNDLRHKSTLKPRPTKDIMAKVRAMAKQVNDGTTSAYYSRLSVDELLIVDDASYPALEKTLDEAREIEVALRNKWQDAASEARKAGENLIDELILGLKDENPLEMFALRIEGIAKKHVKKAKK